MVVQQIAAELKDDVARRLDVHRPPDHLHQLSSQGDQVRGDVRIVIAQRSGVNARHEKATWREEQQCTVANERHVHVARTRAIGVKWRAVVPASAGDGTAAYDDCRPGRHNVFDLPAKCVECIGTPAECESNDVVTLLLLAKVAVSLTGRGAISHTLGQFKDRADADFAQLLQQAGQVIGLMKRPTTGQGSTCAKTAGEPR